METLWERCWFLPLGTHPSQFPVPPIWISTFRTHLHREPKVGCCASLINSSVSQMLFWIFLFGGKSKLSGIYIFCYSKEEEKWHIRGGMRHAYCRCKMYAGYYKFCMGGDSKAHLGGSLYYDICHPWQECTPAHDAWIALLSLLCRDFHCSALSTLFNYSHISNFVHMLSPNCFPPTFHNVHWHSCIYFAFISVCLGLTHMCYELFVGFASQTKCTS